MITHESEILFEGECAYAVHKGKTYDIIVHSSNYVTHVIVGTAETPKQAERVTRRLNAYPRQAREMYGL